MPREPMAQRFNAPPVKRLYIWSSPPPESAEVCFKKSANAPPLRPGVGIMATTRHTTKINNVKRILDFNSGILKQSPDALPQMLAAVDFSLTKPKQIIIAGLINSDDTKMMLKTLHEFYIPNKVVIHADSENESNYVNNKLEIVRYMKMIGGRATAYVCENYACKLPTNDLDIFISQLDESSKL